MKKKIVLSAALLAAMTTLNAAEDLGGMFAEGKVSGQVRMFGISRSVEDTRPGKDEYRRKANAVGGHLKYDTAEWNGLSLGAAFYTTNGFALESGKTDYTKVDPTLLGKDNDAYSVLGEAYVRYKNAGTTFKGGRQKLNTPLLGADDARMLPNLFEAYMLSNTDISDTTLELGHVTRFAQGTFGRAYDGGVLSMTSGYSKVDSRDQVGRFVDVGSYAIGESTGGITTAAVIYTGVKGVKLQAWDYYAHDIMNALYLQADMSWDCLLNPEVKMYAAVQYINEKDVGSNSVISEVDGQYTGIKLGAKVNNFNVYGAYSQAGDNTGAEANGGIITPWGGMPAFTQGMVTRHMFLAGTKAFKAAGTYNWKDLGANLSTTLYYASFDMDTNNAYSADHDWTAKEAGFDIIYNPSAVKNLQLRLRGNHAMDFFENSTGAVSWDEYRFIANYNF